MQLGTTCDSHTDEECMYEGVYECMCVCVCVCVHVCVCDIHSQVTIYVTKTMETRAQRQQSSRQ
jgi:hypothetical protein